MSAAPSLPIEDVQVDVAIDDERWRQHGAIDLQIGALVATAQSFLDKRGLQSGEVSILLTGDAHMQILNSEYRGVDRPTNVLSFAQDQPLVNADLETPRLLGDIVLAFETVSSEAAAAGKPFLNHVSHLVVHGLLHLQGFDHQNDTKALEMERLERHILTELGVPDPYSGDAPGANKPAV